MDAVPSYPLRIFFDGSCSVCSGEMELYRRKEHGGRLLFVDISAPGFEPVTYGLTLEALMYEMHAMDSEKRIYRGVDAFRAIWKAFPALSRYGLLAVLINLPGVHLLARLAYWNFARLRKYLPQNHSSCSNGNCGLGRNIPPRD